MMTMFASSQLRPVFWLGLATLLALGCGDDGGTDVDGGLDAGADAGELDAGLDAGELDAGEIDAGTVDGGLPFVGLAGEGWTNIAFAEATGNVQVEFDMRALAEGVNGVVGLSSGYASAYTHLGAIVRMNEDGLIDARDGDAYAADESVSYASGEVVHVLMDLDFSAHTYSVTLSTAAGSTQLLTDAAFRDEALIDEADYLAFYEPDDALEVANLKVGGADVEMVAAERPVPTEACDTYFTQDFDSLDLGTFTNDRVRAEWSDCATVNWAQTYDRVTVMEEAGNRFIRVNYPEDGVGPSGGGAQWWTTLSQSFDEFYVSYRVRFREGFDFVRGGKLPGLLGGEGNTGGDTPDGTDGWSGRMMWHTGGGAIQYVYHADQPGQYGEGVSWGRTFPTNEWVTVEHHVVINTPGTANGVIEGWYNGEQAFSRSNFLFRTVDTFSIDGFYFSTFFGGSSAAYAATADEYADFDDFIFSVTPITH